MITFYPGPSKLHASVKRHFETAFDKGLISYNHRSRVFSKIIEETTETLRNKLNVLNDYFVAYTSSATECWEIIAQSLVQNSCLNIYNGAFGEKWHTYTKNLAGTSYNIEYDYNTPLAEVNLPNQSFDVICLTHCETSNGTSISNEEIKDIRTQYPDSVIAVDATSSMAGIEIDFTKADVWFASVQKCFGLPAGMAVMIYSPKAIEQASKIGEKIHYNSFTNIHQNAVKHQTTHTPNTTNIYLLNEVMKELPSITEVSTRINSQAKDWYQFFEESNCLDLLIKNKICRSNTVIAIEAEEILIDDIKQKAEEANILLGRGYGKWLNKSFRIANFPAIEAQEIIVLKTFFKNYFN